jgi:hypothetical protein
MDVVNEWLVTREERDEVDVGGCLLTIRQLAKFGEIRRVSSLWFFHTPMNTVLRDVVRARQEFDMIQYVLRRIPESFASGSFVLHLYLRMLGRRPSWTPDDLDIFVCGDRVSDLSEWSAQVDRAFGKPIHIAPYARTLYGLFHDGVVTPSDIPDDGWVVDDWSVPLVVCSRYHWWRNLTLNVTVIQTDSVSKLFGAFDFVHNAIAIDKDTHDFIVDDETRRVIHDQRMRFADGAFSFRGSIAASVSHQRDRVEKYKNRGFLEEHHGSMLQHA